jgi:ABC-type molybdenum transport system ATPase subunit/photorepair protein PhrA
VDGLNIIVTSSAADSTEDASKPKTKGKSKAKAAGRELISDAHLRLKAGVHYGLLGRNGTGKSSKIDVETSEFVNIDICSSSSGNGRETYPWHSTCHSHGDLAAD